MPVRVVTSQSQQALTVNALVENPLIIPERIIKVLDNQFVMDQVLRNAGKATGGAVSFRVSSGLFADDVSEIVAEGAEIPLVTRTRGDLTRPASRSARSASRSPARCVLRNAMGEVNNQLTTLRNTIVRDIDGAFVTTLRNGGHAVGRGTERLVVGSATIRKTSTRRSC
jgi:hypothetical protein